MPNGTSIKRQHKKRYPRKNNASKRRSRRNESAKYQNRTKRKMNKMKGGAGKWECTCASSDKSNDIQPQPPTESPFASYVEKNSLSEDELARRQKITEQQRAYNPYLRTKLPASDNLSLKTDIATRLAASRARRPYPLNVDDELSRPTSPHSYWRPPPPPEKVRSLLGNNMIRLNEKGKYQVDSREQLPYGFIDIKTLYDYFAFIF
jgi:hypothetical protein